MKAHLLWGILLFVLWNPTLSAQDTLFFSTYGNNAGDEEMETLIQLNDSGLLMGGTSDSYGSGDGDLLLIKTGINGTVEWAKTYGGTGDDMATDVKETANGGYIVAGWTQSFGAEGYDCWILKLDKNGAVQWQKRYGGDGNDQAWSVSIDNDGYFVVGGTDSYGAGLTDLLAFKIDLNGNMVWQKTYGGLEDDAPPGDYDEYVAKGLINQYGNYLICGETESFGHGGSDIFLAELNSTNGNIVWQYAYGNVEDESVWSFARSTQGGYYLSGNTTDPNSYDGDLWLVFVDTSGTIKWQKTFGVSNLWDEALNTATLTDGSILLSGYIEQTPSQWTATALKVDLNGNLIWANSYKTGDLDWINAAFPLRDKTLAFAGVTTDITTWNEEITLMRTDGTGMVSGCDLIAPFTPEVKSTATSKQSIHLSVSATTIAPVSTAASVHDVRVSSHQICSQRLTSIGEEQREDQRFSLYPNPTAGNITLKFNTTETKVTTFITNQLGQKIERETRFRPSVINLSLPDAPGLYFIEVIFDNGEHETVKIFNHHSR